LQLFTLTDEPVIHCLVPNPIPASQPGSPQIVRVKGVNFGVTQGSSTFHFHQKIWGEGHPKIWLWSDSKIKFKVPATYPNPYFSKFKDVWVTVNGKDSNKVQLKITAP